MPKKREFKPTSKQGEQHIAPFKQSHKEKIVEALKKLKAGGTQEEIATECGLRPDQVWKRMVDLCKDERVFDTGLTRKLKSGVQGIVWQTKEKDLNNWFAEYQQEKPTPTFYQPNLL